MKIRLALIAFVSILSCLATFQSAGASPLAAKPISKDRAVEVVWQLPEVRAWAESVEKQSKGKAHGASKIDDDPEVVDGKRYWSVTCFVDHPDHINRWHTFLIRLDGKEILADSPASGDFTTLELWRLREKPVHRIEASASK